MEHLWFVVEQQILIMDVQMTYLQYLEGCNFTKIPEESSPQLAEATLQRIKVFMKPKEHNTWH